MLQNISSEKTFQFVIYIENHFEFVITSKTIELV